MPGLTPPLSAPQQTIANKMQSPPKSGDCIGSVRAGKLAEVFPVQPRQDIDSLRLERWALLKREITANRDRLESGAWCCRPVSHTAKSKWKDTTHKRHRVHKSLPVC